MKETCVGVPATELDRRSPPLQPSRTADESCAHNECNANDGLPYPASPPIDRYIRTVLEIVRSPAVSPPAQHGVDQNYYTENSEPDPYQDRYQGTGSHVPRL